MKSAILVTGALLLGLPALGSAHDEAKTPITPSMILDITRPAAAAAPARDRAYDEAIKQSPPAAPRSLTDGEIQPDGSVRYGNTTVIIRHDCPPGGEFYQPPPLPGRRR